VIYEEHRQNFLGETKLIVCNFGPGYFTLIFLTLINFIYLHSGNVKGTEMYAVGAPACEVFSDQYSGLCSTREINLKFEAPCESAEFKARYAVLCDEVSFLQTYPIQGMEKLLDCGSFTARVYISLFAVSSSTKSAWKIIIIVLVLLLCLGVSGFIVYKLHQDGKIHMPDIDFHTINLNSCRC